jgi:hypothetical protein
MCMLPIWNVKNEEPRSEETGVQEQRSADAEQLDSWRPRGVASDGGLGAARQPAAGPQTIRHASETCGGDDRQLQFGVAHHGSHFQEQRSGAATVAAMGRRL